jgi:hypothetical protein
MGNKTSYDQQMRHRFQESGMHRCMDPFTDDDNRRPSTWKLLFSTLVLLLVHPRAGRKNIVGSWRWSAHQIKYSSACTIFMHGRLVFSKGEHCIPHTTIGGDLHWEDAISISWLRRCPYKQLHDRHWYFLIVPFVGGNRLEHVHQTFLRVITLDFFSVEEERV